MRGVEGKLKAGQLISLLQLIYQTKAGCVEAGKRGGTRWRGRGNSGRRRRAMKVSTGGESLGGGRRRRPPGRAVPVRVRRVHAFRRGRAGRAAWGCSYAVRARGRRRGRRQRSGAAPVPRGRPAAGAFRCGRRRRPWSGAEPVVGGRRSKAAARSSMAGWRRAADGAREDAAARAAPPESREDRSLRARVRGGIRGGREGTAGGTRRRLPRRSTGFPAKRGMLADGTGRARMAGRQVTANKSAA